MNPIAPCPHCGAPVPAGDDLACPACALRAALALDAERAGLPPAPEHRAPRLFPRRFGDYELLEEIGRGGMGVVYKARQISLGRIVAVKMIRASHLASEADMLRFRTEAGAAAQLQHPGIVAIHEVGERDGEPWFSMEYVEGPTLAELVREHPLPAARAARYVQLLAEAAHYAHQRGILHRDLKPANVLVDASDQPRLTDFGLAKRLVPEFGIDQPRSTITPTPMPQLTVTGQLVGSPGYMPPEQISGTYGGVGPQSDVYALGALLYHLVTTRPPFVAEGIEAVLAQVTLREPVSPRRLNPAVPRDLETICLKCLEKEPARRYGTAHELAEDLQACREGKPIKARPASPAERAWKWSQRNRALAATAGALVLAIGLGFAGVLWQLKRAKAETKRADTAAVKSDRIARFLGDMLTGVGPSAARGRDTGMLREILEKTNRRLGELKDEPEVEAQLRFLLGRVYGDLGDYTNAETMLRRAVLLRQEFPGPQQLDLAAARNELGLALQKQRKFAEAEALYLQALGVRSNVLGPAHPLIAVSLHNLATVLVDQGRFADATTNVVAALAMQRSVLGSNDEHVAASLDTWGRILSKQQLWPQAESKHREALQICEAKSDPDHPFMATVANNLAVALQRQRKNQEAEPYYDQAYQIRKKLHGANDPQVAIVRDNLAFLRRRLGKFAEAETLYQEALDAARIRHGQDSPNAAAAAAPLVQVLIEQRQPAKLAEAESLARAARAILERLMPDDWHAFEAQLLLGNALLAQQQSTEAGPLMVSAYDGLLQRKDGISEAGRVRVRDTLQRVVQLYADANQSGNAGEWKLRLAQFNQAPAGNSPVNETKTDE